MAGWVYILKLSNGKYYYGSTSDLFRRLESHQSGKSDYTKKYLPAELVFSQEYPDYSKARKIEKWLKNLKNTNIIERIIKEGVIKSTAL
jgi:putative endonuclease